MKNIVKLTLPCITLSVDIALATMTAFLTQVQATRHDMYDLRTALSEAVNNCLLHAYPDKPGKIYISMALSEAQFVVKVKDTGVGIEDVEAAMLPLFTTKSDTLNGLGFSVIEPMVDELKIKSKPGKGTTVILRRKLKIK